MLRILLKTFLLVTFLFFARVTPAADHSTQTRNLNRSEIQNIKIIPHKKDKVILYITGKDSQKYRLGNLTHHQAVAILGRMKQGDGLELSYSQQVAAYHDVLSWK